MARGLLDFLPCENMLLLVGFDGFVNFQLELLRDRCMTVC